MLCHITLYFGWTPDGVPSYVEARIFQLSSLLQDSCKLSILSPRWRNQHIQACKYETTGMCSRFSVATSQEKNLLNTWRNNNPKSGFWDSSMLLERESNMLLWAECSVKSWVKVCLECPLCNINHKSNIHYIKKRRGYFGTPGYEGFWRRLAHVEWPVVLVTHAQNANTRRTLFSWSTGLLFTGCVFACPHPQLVTQSTSLVSLMLCETEMETGIPLGW